MIFQKLTKFKKAVIAFLLVGFLLPSVTSPTLAYDSMAEDVGPMEYYSDVFLPALESGAMNLESFVSETFKAVTIGMPLYILHKFALNRIIQAVICASKIVTIPFGTAVPAFTECSELIRILTDAQNPPEQKSFLASVSEGMSSRSKFISGANFIDYYAQKLGLATQAHAQGTPGFSALSADTTIRMWSSFRNSAYALIAVGLVIVGFMIMFRMKISPQAVVTIQTAIPKLITVLILITFSYAIVGLLIDLAWVLTIAAGTLIGSPGIMNSIVSDNIVGVFFDVGMWSNSLLTAFAVLYGSLTSMFLALATGVFILPLVIFIVLGVIMVIIAFRLLFQFSFLVS